MKALPNPCFRLDRFAEGYGRALRHPGGLWLALTS